MRYYVEYPRGFANEYTVEVVRDADVVGFEAANPDAIRITKSPNDEPCGWAGLGRDRLDDGANSGTVVLDAIDA